MGLKYKDMITVGDNLVLNLKGYEAGLNFFRRFRYGHFPTKQDALNALFLYGVSEKEYEFLEKAGKE